MKRTTDNCTAIFAALNSNLPDGIAENTNTNTQEAAETQDQTAGRGISRSRYRCRRHGQMEKYLSVYLCFTSVSHEFG